MNKFVKFICAACTIPASFCAYAGDGPVALWSFDDDASLKNGASLVDEGIGKAVLLDGKDDYVDGGKDAKLDLREHATLMAWLHPINPKSGAGEPLIVGKGLYAYGLAYNPGQIWFYISDGAWNCVADIPTRQWTHVTGSYDGRKMRLYVNGKLTSTYTMPEPNTRIRQASPHTNPQNKVYLGRRGDAYFAGMIDEASVYDRALGADEILAVYTAQKAKLKRPPPVRRDDLKGLALKVFDAGDQRTTILVDQPQSIDGDMSVPANVTLRFRDAGSCNINAGATLTIHGAIEAPVAPIFDGGGKVVVNRGKVQRVYPQWFGAEVDDGGDDSRAIQAAIDALPTGGVVYLPPGRYDIRNTIKVHSNIAMIGGIGQARLHASRPLPAVVQRPDLTPPPDGIHFNATTRVDGARFENLRVEAEDSTVGMDLTNMNYMWIENVEVIHAGTGFMFAQLGMYNTLHTVSVASCDVGIEAHIGVMNNNLFGGRISNTRVGILCNTASQLNMYGVTFDMFKEVGLDVTRGDHINLHYPWFDSVEGAVPMRVSAGASGCTIVNPRFSGPTPKIIDDQSNGEALMVINNSHSAKHSFRGRVVRSDRIITEGLTATDSLANNLRGRVELTGEQTKVDVTFAEPEPDADYYLTATPVTSADGTWTVHIAQKTPEGFEAVLNAAPGTGRKVEINWMLMR